VERRRKGTAPPATAPSPQGGRDKARGSHHDDAGTRTRPAHLDPDDSRDYPSPGIIVSAISPLCSATPGSVPPRRGPSWLQPWGRLTRSTRFAGDRGARLHSGPAPWRTSARPDFVPIRKKGKLPYKARQHRILARIRRGRKWKCTRDGVAMGEARSPGRRPCGHRRQPAEAAVKLLRKIGAEGIGRLLHHRPGRTSAAPPSCGRSTCRCGRLISFEGQLTFRKAPWGRKKLCSRSSRRGAAGGFLEPP